ncbi:uncharacterized protein LOC131312888 isoform X1 [Rhododendron vialii]|uniref:uncharacterized protein LOC131312888 isoform X1 n=1 Tax=Rhododendron vialii TaxID=182163 RepID=UPI00265EB039|nr:uncharacterized protein LOC131312888 isoform X1 [Rhododendron vialii]XP_058196885.1 uncharacterized protein LOC131312888 isoform X1 [Rhododendron vialii]
MSTRGGGRGGRGGRGMTGHGITPHGVTTRSVLTPAMPFTPNNGVTTRSMITPTVQSTPNNDPEQNSSAALHISESEQPNESLTPEDAPVTKQVRGRTKGLALAKIRRRGEKVKLGFSRMLGQPTSDNEDDLTRYTTELGIIIRQFAPLQAKSWKVVPQDAKEMCIAHIREKFDLPEATYVDKAILQSMGKRYCDCRSRLKKKFEKGAVDCPTHIDGADWGYLSNLWQDKDYQEKCDKYKDSRSKPRNHHVAGSKAFYKVKNHLKKKNNGLNPDLPETWMKTHYSEKRKCWTDGSETIYKKLKDVQDQAMANGSVPLTDEELSCTVFGSKPGYIRGLGHGPKPSLTKSGQTSRAQLIRDAEEAREETTAAQKRCEEALVEAALARKNTEQLAETVANMQSQLNFLLQQNGHNMSSNDANYSTNDGDRLVDEDAMEY